MIAASDESIETCCRQLCAAEAVQPEATRVIDLRADEEALWGDLRKKWRQYVNKARSGGGPSLIECLTYRHSGHSRADPAKYRPEGELERWKQKDPIKVYRERLRSFGIPQETIDGIDKDVARIVPRPAGGSEQDHERHIERASIEHSLANLRTFPWIRMKENRGEIGLHGAWFDIATGELHVYDEDKAGWDLVPG